MKHPSYNSGIWRHHKWFLASGSMQVLITPERNGPFCPTSNPLLHLQRENPGFRGDLCPFKSHQDMPMHIC